MDKESLKQIRKKAELTQAEFGKAIGVSGRTVESWEQGRRNTTELARREINRKFGKEIMDLRAESAARQAIEAMQKSKAMRE